MARGFALLALLAAAAPARAEFQLAPTVVGEADYRVYQNEGEGENGFALGRAILGARADLAPGLRAVLSAQFVGGEGPSLFDAYGSYRFGVWELRAGYSRTPLFASARDDEIEMLAIPELSVLASALWPGRNLGAELHASSPKVPIEGWLRIGNGGDSISSNENRWPSVDARVDLAWGRARAGAKAGAPFGVRFGIGGHADNAADRPGIAGHTATDFIFFRAPTVDGWVTVAEAHLQLLLGPVQVRCEGGWARESRSLDTTGDPSKPRTPLDPITSLGASAEVAWMVTGARRASGLWPTDDPRVGRWGALELAARGERLNLGRGATGANGVSPDGVTAVAATLRWWTKQHIAIAVAGYLYDYDQAPLETPGKTLSIVAMARATVSLR